MKIALIGASGFVGTRLIDLLRNESKKYQLTNIDLQPSYFFNDITVIGDYNTFDNQIIWNASTDGTTGTATFY